MTDGKERLRFQDAFLRDSNPNSKEQNHDLLKKKKKKRQRELRYICLKRYCEAKGVNAYGSPLHLETDLIFIYLQGSLEYIL